MEQRLLDILVTDGDDIATVQQFRNAYQQAHPAWSVRAWDYGDQVAVGTTTTKLFLSKITAPETEKRESS